MAKEQFIERKFNAASLQMIAQANQILEEYHRQGFTMTLRQLHYQFVARDLYGNTQQNYKRLGSIMSDGRLSGLVDWTMMEDRLRELDARPRWESPSSIVDAIAEQYREDAWAGQKFRPEVWIEKDALAGVIENVCHELRVDFFACRGYVSQSAQYKASKRFLRYDQNGQRPIIFHLGDHDPSGIDMSRENAEKFALLTGISVPLRRLALNMHQVQQYNPPPNPVKLTDSRVEGYMREYGTNECWELDALDPPVIEALIRDAINPLINTTVWDNAMLQEREGRERLAQVSERWDEIKDFLDG